MSTPRRSSRRLVGRREPTPPPPPVPKMSSSRRKRRPSTDEEASSSSEAESDGYDDTAATSKQSIAAPPPPTIMLHHDDTPTEMYSHEQMTQLSRSNPQQVVQSMWEVPSVANFFAVFHQELNLIDIDIDDFEEALLTDVSRDSRSSMIVDVLMTLAKGISGRRDVNLLNYHNIVYDVINNHWRTHTGESAHPLGDDKDSSDVHSLPVHAKVLLLQAMCQWRLQRNDVENAIKDMEPDALRITPVCEGLNGSKYWYFYGIRLYHEEQPPRPPTPKVTIKTPTKKKTRTPAKRARQTRNSLASVDPPVRALPMKQESTDDDDVKEGSPREKEGSPKDEEGETPKVVPSSTTISEKIRRIYANDEEDSRDSIKTDDKNISNGVDDASVKTSPSLGEEGDKEMKEKEREAAKALAYTAYQQEYFLVDKLRLSRWSVVCTTVADWKALAESVATSRNANHKYMAKVLQEEFLPYIDELERQLTSEREKRMLLAAPRRASDRIEVRKLQKEEGEGLLREKEDAERERQRVRDDDRMKRNEMNSREERAKLRERERQKTHRLKARAQEGLSLSSSSPSAVERARRAEYRRTKAEYSRQGIPVPHDIRQMYDDEGSDDAGSDYRDSGESGSESEREIEMHLDRMYTQMEKVMDSLKVGPEATPFLAPVDRELVPDYYDVIKNPVDLTSIEKKVVEREFDTKTELIDEMNTLFLNCLRYNGPNNEYTRQAQRLERAFIRAWKRYFPVATNESARRRKELGKCISKLGELDRQIHEMTKTVRPPTAPRIHRPRTVTNNMQPAMTPADRLLHQSRNAVGPIPGDDAPRKEELYSRTVVNGKCVYCFMGADGEKRMFRFVSGPNDQLPSAALIDQVIPQIKKDVDAGKFQPRNIITVRLDTAPKPRAPAPAATLPPPPAKVFIRQSNPSVTSPSVVLGQPSPSSCDFSGDTLLSSSHERARTYHLTESQYLQFDKGIAYMTVREDASQNLRRVAMVTVANVEKIRQLDVQRKEKGLMGLPPFVWHAINTTITNARQAAIPSLSTPNMPQPRRLLGIAVTSVSQVGVRPVATVAPQPPPFLDHATTPQAVLAAKPVTHIPVQMLNQPTTQNGDEPSTTHVFAATSHINVIQQGGEGGVSVATDNKLMVSVNGAAPSVELPTAHVNEAPPPPT